jgi:hypothetical protein
MQRLEPTPEQIAQFQAGLLELLAQDLPVEELQKRLKEEEAFAAFREYVQSFEPRMMEVASLLVKKWGKRSALKGSMTEG